MFGPIQGQGFVLQRCLGQYRGKTLCYSVFRPIKGQDFVLQRCLGQYRGKTVLQRCLGQYRGKALCYSDLRKSADCCLLIDVS